MRLLLAPLVQSAERRVRTAALVACALGFLSLLTTARIWRERRHPDFELLLGAADALLVLGLAWALSRGSRAAGVALLLLALAGAALAVARGLPAAALVPQAVAALVDAGALLALGDLRRLRGGYGGGRRAAPPPSPS